MRLPSIDILRTFAIFVMVLVHFGENLSGFTSPFTTSILLALVFLACCYGILRQLGPDRTYGIESWMRWLCD